MPKQISYFSIRSDQICKLLPYYNLKINDNIQVLMAKSIEILALPDCKGHNSENKYNEWKRLFNLSCKLTSTRGLYQYRLFYIFNK